MPSLSINSNDLDKLGVNLKDILIALSKVDKNKSGNNDVIRIKKRKRKRKILKKIKKTEHALQNHKPNFTSNNNQIGGSGGVGGTTFNPLYQRQAPTVTSVVNVPPNNDGKNDITTYLLGDKKNNDRFNQLDHNIGNTYDKLSFGMNFLNNKINTKLLSQNTDSNIIEVGSDEVNSDDGVGFNTSSYQTPFSKKLKSNKKTGYSLSDQPKVNFRNKPVDSNDRFGNMPINHNPIPLDNTTQVDDTQVDNPAIDNTTQEIQPETIDETKINETPEAYTEPLPQLGSFTDIQKAYDIVNGNDNNNNNDEIGYDTLNEMLTNEMFNKLATDVKERRGDVNYSDSDYFKNLENNIPKYKESDKGSDDDSESWKQRDRLEAQLQREIKAKKIEEEAQAKAQRKLEKQQKKQSNPLTSESIQSQSKSTNNNSNLTKQSGKKKQNQSTNPNELLDLMNSRDQGNYEEENITKRKKTKSKKNIPNLDIYEE